MSGMYSSLPPDAVVGYCRYSSNNQREESISAQKRYIITYANSNGLEIDKFYVDEAFSGKTDKRPAFQQMIEEAKAGRIRKVIVHKLDRFSRSMTDTVNYRNQFRDLNVDLISVAEDFEPTPAGNLMTTMVAAFNQYYVENLATEVMKGLVENAMQGISTGGPPPLGYTLDEQRRLVINPEEAEIIRIVFDMYVAGYGYKAIVNHLNESGYRTRQGKLFTGSSIHEFLCNGKYKGELIFNKKVSASFDGKRNNHRNKPRDKWIIYPGGCPAIVSVETWDRAQAILRTHRRGNGMASQHPYLISRLVFCAHCGKRMYGEYRRDRNASYRTYRCGHKERTCNCVSKAIRGDALEHYVVDAISGLLTSWDNAGNIAETINIGSERAMVEDIDHCVLKTSLERLYVELENLSSSIAKVGYEDLLGAKLAYLKQEITEKEGQLKRREEVLEAQRYSQEEVYRHIHTILQRYSEHDVYTQAQCMLIDLVDKIMISNDKVDVYLRVEFPPKVAGETPPVYEKLLSVSRNDLFRLYPMDRYNDDWAVMDKLYDLCVHHEAR